jgi:hypothetical protein
MHGIVAYAPNRDVKRSIGEIMERKTVEKLACIAVALFSTVLCAYTTVRRAYYDDCFRHIVGSHIDKYTRAMLGIAGVLSNYIELFCGLGFIMLVPACMNRTFSRTARAVLVGYFLFLGPAYYFASHEGYVTVAMENLKFYSQPQKVNIEQADDGSGEPNP